ncbi:chalcone-flavanone isomerase-domain-containing protein [Coniella lustricola]|uniref:Chalcone-flavanone isomerase-domain-containing protein n=1 Tax=Coniella lustricola TaxID=2025994 RepID=A0A2T3A2Q5_9PEZI|nr:chalcone-flavanone isomerase-domain-containing protein [Coniella lustricola]
MLPSQPLTRGLRRSLALQSSRVTQRCTRPTHSRTFFLRSREQPSRRAALDTLNVQRMARQHADYQHTRQQILAGGAAAGIISIIYVCYKIGVLLLEDPSKAKNPGASTTQLDSALPSNHPINDASRPLIRHDEEGHELVPTGNSTVPEFPRVVELGDFKSTPGAQDATDPLPTNAIPSVTGPTLVIQPSAATTTEYTLVGLGTRTVSFLGINVYVLGYYIATADIAELQARLVKQINPIASTLVSTEKDDLRKKLLDVKESEELWNELLRSGVPARSMVRVVPVRDTDFGHLRDGFVRAIQARMSKEQDEAFGEAMREFKRIFSRGKVPKQKELILLRDREGKLTMVYDEGKSEGRQLLGTVADERISRALWMNYLGGKNPASEEARKSIINGVMGFVERPVGTVAAQVI